MSTVYVRWYGNVVQGELLDGETMGMKHVRIPLDGHHPVALFTPQHIYDSPEQVTEKSSINVAKSVEISQNPPKIATEQPKVPTEIATKDILPADDRQMIEAFKQANWDHERNHLRIDKLDEFYQLWRMVMTPFGFTEHVPRFDTTSKGTDSKGTGSCSSAQVPVPDIPKKQKYVQCERCSRWVFTKTLGSPENPVWHCRHGFLPSADCQKEAAYNEDCMRKHPKQRPKRQEPVQLSLFD